LEMAPFDRGLGLGVDVGVFFAIVVVNGGLWKRVCGKAQSGIGS
jgi:hypothetical protein